MGAGVLAGMVVGVPTGTLVGVATGSLPRQPVRVAANAGIRRSAATQSLRIDLNVGSSFRRGAITRHAGQGIRPAVAILCCYDLHCADSNILKEMRSKAALRVSVQS